MKIWKYKIDDSDCIIDIPEDSRILSLQVQEEVPCIWVLVNPDNPKITRRFITYVTGSFADILPAIDIFIGTYQVGWLVNHVFERIIK